MKKVMHLVGIRELKQHTSELLRRVREDGETIEVTYHGRIIARIIPVNGSEKTQDAMSVWADMDLLAAEIGANWPEGVSAEDAINDVRREL